MTQVLASKPAKNTLCCTRDEAGSITNIPVDIDVQRLAHSLMQPHQGILDLAPLLSLDYRCAMPGSRIKRGLVREIFFLYLHVGQS